MRQTEVSRSPVYEPTQRLCSHGRPSSTKVGCRMQSPLVGRQGLACSYVWHVVTPYEQRHRRGKSHWLSGTAARVDAPASQYAELLKDAVSFSVAVTNSRRSRQRRVEYQTPVSKKLEPDCDRLVAEIIFSLHLISFTGPNRTPVDTCMCKPRRILPRQRLACLHLLLILDLTFLSQSS
ncbi:uncharacterized protein BO66DRAFT_251191 [Aspergillus aculeatinus CBS 121060]|uniref:Uncharacterized protein n=1 Tax=Aspergillus aculeatinus CBS 121060 TaxID=1448322 RepID=A0ACD1HGM7_9EURO|nr:hypothetical protein BO66DRAFT_251191 [Aspergillus aculeatinus CBS 121060]RAH72953.1 hypothetical protein BO66DRAFT_251191 [Aspergillus aculeatinus CBS 121060]